MINAIRLSPAGEEVLTALGEVAQVVRIGNYRGMDDRWLAAIDVEQDIADGLLDVVVEDLGEGLAMAEDSGIPGAEALGAPSTKGGRA